MCLFRQGDMDWLSCFQLHKQLLSNISSSTLSQRASKGEKLCDVLCVLFAVPSTAGQGCYQLSPGL